MAGFCWGAKRYDRVREGYRFSLWACVIGISVFAGLVAILAQPLLLLFTEEDEELVRIGVFSLRMQCLAMPFHGYAIVTNMLCAGIGRPCLRCFWACPGKGSAFSPFCP